MKNILLIIILLGSFNLKASHIVGGEIYYDYLGNNNYRFFISMYRDCNSNGAQFDAPLMLAVYNSGGGLVQNISVPYPGSTMVPVVFNNPCVTPPSNICTENAVYTTVVNLPPLPGGYTVSYQRCCRKPSITNLINPGDLGFTLTCHVPGPANFQNSSPRFVDYPPLVLCNNEDLIFDHSATDPDNDQLVYSLVTPFHGGGNNTSGSGCASCVAPSPATAPPYPPTPWAPGFSATAPLGPGSSISIDPNTGLLIASPNLLGKFVVGVQVEEIRNGVVINKTVRDFIFEVFNCVVQLSAILPAQEDLPDFVSYCQGYTINFVNNSFGGTNYLWDFGDPTTTSDVSTQFAPSYTYPADGNYQATLIVNPGWPCTDTTVMDILVNHVFETSFTSNDSICINENSFDFVGSSTYPTATYTWDFGQNAMPDSASGQTVNNVHFTTTGTIPVTIHAENAFCEADYTNTIYIYPEPIAEMVLPQNFECNGLTVDFGNNSQNANRYLWDFGVPGISSDTSSMFETSYTFSPGTYDITLIASSANCSDTTMESITLNVPLSVDFTSQDSMCVTNNSFDFIGQVTGPPGSIYTWDFGTFANPQTSNNISELGVNFVATGLLPITLTGTHENCTETVTHNIYIVQEPQINFKLEPGLQCEPFPAQFIDLSFAETPISYAWDFGDGTTSNEANPLHVYPFPGNYPVTLTISTAAGCIDTLSLIEPDLITVHPKPTAAFSISTDDTDICHSLVSFTDQSFLAETIYYDFDDNGASIYEANPDHVYISDGSHRPVQIVTTEFGCKDSAYQELTIQPFTLFVPNAFTPNGNGFNDTFLPVVYLDVLEWKFQIFNRWGELVFETLDVNEPWDGTTPNGEIAQNDEYVWKITFVSCEPINPEQIITGMVNLTR